MPGTSVKREMKIRCAHESSEDCWGGVAGTADPCEGFSKLRLLKQQSDTVVDRLWHFTQRWHRVCARTDRIHTFLAVKAIGSCCTLGFSFPRRRTLQRCDSRSGFPDSCPGQLLPCASGPHWGYLSSSCIFVNARASRVRTRNFEDLVWLLTLPSFLFVGLPVEGTKGRE